MIPLASNRRRPRGFTLVELLTVIAIIALLTAILFPVMATVRKNAREGGCMSNMHSIIQGLKMYKDDWRVYPDALYGIDYGSGPGTRLYPEYVKDEKVFNCPESLVKTNDRSLVAPVNPMTGAVAMGQNPATGMQTAYGLFSFSSYDFQRRPNSNAVGVTPALELHYRRQWNTAGPSIFDEPRQLIYKDPPDSTVVTWCLYHSDMDPAGNPGRERLALVAFLSGRVQKLPAETVANWPSSCTSPSAGTPPQGCPWQVSPKP